MQQVTLSEQPIEFVIPGAEGFKIDLLEAELLIEEASNLFEREFTQYAPKLAELLAKKCNVQLGSGQLWKFVQAVTTAYDEFKKKFDAELLLALGIESTPSPSPSEST